MKVLCGHLQFIGHQLGTSALQHCIPPESDFLFLLRMNLLHCSISHSIFGYWNCESWPPPSFGSLPLMSVNDSTRSALSPSAVTTATKVEHGTTFNEAAGPTDRGAERPTNRVPACQQWARQSGGPFPDIRLGQAPGFPRWDKNPLGQVLDDL